MNPNMTNLLRSAAFGALLLTGAGTYAYDADTLAFYPFCDGVNGANLTSIRITNAVDSAVHFATSRTTMAWAGGGVWATNAVPGKYINIGSGYHEDGPHYTTFGSICLAGRCGQEGISQEGKPYGANSAANVSIDGLSSRLSSCEKGWTIETYCYIPVNKYVDSSGLFVLNAGLAYSGSTAQTIKVMPTSESGDWWVDFGGTVYPIRVSLGRSNVGSWFHLALTYNRATGKMRFYLDHTQKSEINVSYIGENSGVNLDVGNLQWRGHICGLRVTARALEASEMLYASDCPTGIPATVFQWPLEGEAGASPTGDMLVAVANSTGIEPVLAERRNGTVYEKDVKVRETRTAVSLTGVPKSGSNIYGSGNCIKVPKDSMEAVVGDFTMEACVKFDYKTWMAKYAEGENRPYVGIFWQDWYDSSGRNVIWSLQLRKRNDIFYPCIYGYYTDWTSFLFEDFTTPIKMDNKWHHYAITYDYAAKTFEVFEDGVSLGTRTLTKQLYLSAQTQYNNGLNYDLMVGYGMACQPFEGLIDEVRYSRKILTPAEFISVDDRQGLLLLFR